MPGLYYLVLDVTGRNFPLAAAVALSGAVLSVTAALVIALRDLRQERVARRRCSEEEVHGYDHAAHG